MSNSFMLIFWITSNQLERRILNDYLQQTMEDNERKRIFSI